MHEPSRSTALLGGCGLPGLGVLPAEALHASGSVDQPLLAGEERVANRANFYVDVALVGRTGLKVAPACAYDPHSGIIRVNLFLGHL